ncbi:DUF1700 domain-containing protein [Chromobacterium subtsugae]|uniref:DUF1700 domain-containing protein n=1 Tax=Chromobacterium subtsugae TaxID=251747 RepID=A0ABS7FIA1_9NEIS|nr:MULTISPECIES: DUF1700 domain-containing protein [Chromobacterium]MBW7567983.1 DUF1700 domain-containing protein [Chromobacterium subtsugae]MBW8289210.1 DUF1700 domain-containing protein [Chromobacterium subtsugae]OBU86463.1 hypothetical protein MY55_09755 [Chromobacterium subtsugae]WSE92692.1 DUF1700 domain-containing protein [Chromobacterium subtsugae]WVH61070.1 DUF1700 domain-containing protein [Chromobacterium subtsugae]
MTRKDFLQQLERALSGQRPEMVREILSDYEEYFNDALADGRDEADVVAALGSPQKLARELKAQNHYRQWEQHRSFGNLSRVVASIAGLGVLNFFLAIPFMVYLMFLTIGYVVSVSFLVAGLAVVLGWGSHSLFGWPEFSVDSLDIGHRGAPGLVDVKADDGSASGEFRIEHGRLVLEPDSGSTIRLTTRQGDPIVVSRNGDSLKVDASQPARLLLQQTDDDEVSINSHAVAALAYSGSGGDQAAFRVDDNGRLTSLQASAGGQEVKIEASGPHGLTVLKDGNSVLEISEKKITVKDGISFVHLDALPGMSVGMSAAIVGLGLLLAGALGLVFCVWLTRLTWRVLVSYVKYQIELVSGKDRENAAA